MNNHSLLLFCSIATWVPIAVSEPLFIESFEAPLVEKWQTVSGDAFSVDASDPSFVKSDFSGVAGSRFLMLGHSNFIANVFFVVPTVPGVSYSLNYSFAATDTFSLPTRVQQVAFEASAVAYKGVESVLSHTGVYVDRDIVEMISAASYSLSTPGTSNWRITQWHADRIDFTALSDVTRLQFRVVSQTGLASSIVLDQVVLNAIPEPSMYIGSVGLIALVYTLYARRSYRRLN